MQLMDNPVQVGAYESINVKDWNGHPVDVHPPRHLLAKLGFVEVRGKGWVYDGTHKPDDETVARAEKDMPECFVWAGKDEAPVTYDADWIISRASQEIQPKLRELINLFERTLPPEFKLTYDVRSFNVLYRGVPCLNPHPRVLKTKIRLAMTYQRGFSARDRGILIEPDTDLSDPEFIADVLAKFERTRQGIDAHLDLERD